MPPFEPQNVVALRHGARSERTVNRIATTQKRRLLRRIGLRAGDLDGIGLAFLDNWARATAKVELLDEWFAEHGFLDPDGNPAGGVKVYFTAVNSSRLSLQRLAGHLSARGQRDPQADLDRYLRETYGDPAA